MKNNNKHVITSILKQTTLSEQDMDIREKSDELIIEEYQGNVIGLANCKKIVEIA